MAKIALQRHHGDVEKAVEELVACGGIIDGEHCTDGRLCFSLYRLALYVTLSLGNLFIIGK
jgi:hypothetical protein